MSPLCPSCYPGTLVRSLFPSPLLCTGNPNDQDESRGGILRPYPARENAPSCGLNNAAISTSDSGQQTFAEPQVSPEDPLGPLPENWEMAYTESGELYFIEYVWGVCPNLRDQVCLWPPDPPPPTHLCMLISAAIKRQRCLTIEGRAALFTVASPVSLVIVASAVLCEGSEGALLWRSCWRAHPRCSFICFFLLRPLCWTVLSFYLFPGSHNTKTTSWLDPRLRDKASRALEECEEDGRLLHTNCQCRAVYLGVAVACALQFKWWM